MDDEYTRFKVCIFGDGAVGKTTLTHRYLQGVFKETYKLTIGIDFYLKKLNINDKKISLQIWDFAGEEKFRFLLPGAVTGAHGTIFMFDLTRYNTFSNLTNWLGVFNEVNEKEGVTVPTLLVGSKLDLSSVRTVNDVEAKEFGKKNKFYDYIECSSKTGENVDFIFESISRKMIKNLT